MHDHNVPRRDSLRGQLLEPHQPALHHRLLERRLPGGALRRHERNHLRNYELELLWRRIHPRLH
jgi:hypothetical protein